MSVYIYIDMVIVMLPRGVPGGAMVGEGAGVFVGVGGWVTETLAFTESIKGRG